MTISTRRRLLLRRVVRKRPPQHSCERKWTDLALKNRHLSSAWSFGCEIGPRFRYNGGLRGGKWDIPAKTVQWSSTADPPEDLASIAIFDCHSAQVYVTSEQEAAYLPYGLDIVEALANTVLPKLSRRLDQELAGINTDIEQFAHLSGDSEAGQLLAGLSHKTDPDALSALAKLSDVELDRINELGRAPSRRRWPGCAPCRRRPSTDMSCRSWALAARFGISNSHDCHRSGR